MLLGLNQCGCSLIFGVLGSMGIALEFCLGAQAKFINIYGQYIFFGETISSKEKESFKIEIRIPVLGQDFKPGVVPEKYK